MRLIQRFRAFLLVSHKSMLAEPPLPLGRIGMLAVCAVTVYAMSVVLAVLAGRHLYADGTMAFLGILCGGRFPQVLGGWKGLYVSRLGAVIYAQSAPRLAEFLGVTDVRVLSLIYGAALYCYKPLGLAVCYLYARGKRWLLFPLLALFAGAINIEAFIIRENQMLMGLFWGVLFILLFAESISGWTLALYLLLSAPLILCYESMVFFGVVLCAACVYRLAVASRSSVDRCATLATLVWFGLGAVIAACSILRPRAPGNRESAVTGIALLFHASPALKAVVDHPGLRASGVILLLVAAMVLCRNGSRVVWWLAAAAVPAALYIPAYLWLYPERTSLNAEMYLRTADLLVALVAVAFLFAVLLRLVRMDAAKYRALFLAVAALGIAQSLWSAMATSQWTAAIGLFRDDLSHHAGVVPFEESVASRAQVGGLPMALMLGEPQWAVLPMSIVFAEHGNVKSLVVMREGIYRPYDPWNPAMLPDLRRYGIHYDEFVKAIGKQ